MYIKRYAASINVHDAVKVGNIAIGHRCIFPVVDLLQSILLASGDYVESMLSLFAFA